MIDNLYADIGYHSLTKHGEIVCGDNIKKIDCPDGSVVLVLADGLGSGVKACILSTLTSLYHVHDQKNALTEITANKYLTDIITYSFTENKETRETVTLQNKLQTIREYLISHSAQKLTLDSLAAMFYISKYHLSREYKRYFGITLMNDLNNMRISTAKSLLRFSDASIESIAEQCGFSDSAYFIKVFKNAENITPYSYRKKW